jgi:hypothetical protein
MSQILGAGRARNLLDFGRMIAFVGSYFQMADGACYFDLIAELDLCCARLVLLSDYAGHNLGGRVRFSLACSQPDP